ncbi:folate-binding protein [Humibacter sp. BT305]|nr:folate-binding protein [Humibacter sp. BT305]
MTSPFLGLPGAVRSEGADEGVPAHYGNPLIEQRRLSSDRGAIVDLSTRGVVSVTGPDRLSWLDSMTSQSIRDLAPGESAETLLLDAQGHVEHAIRLIDDGGTAWLLVETAETAPLAAWLDRMRFMLRVEVSDRSSDLATIGSMTQDGDLPAELAAVAETTGDLLLSWRDPWSELVAGGVQYAQADEHPAATWTWRETLVARERLPELAAAVADGRLDASGVLAAEALRVAAWRPRWSTEVDERTIPHELDWMRSAVHLDKGCYRGQETVAKVHNLGHPPRRLVMLHLDGADAVLPAPGDEVAPPEPDADAVGRITSVATHFEWGPIALAVLRRSTPVDAPLVVRTGEGEVAAAQQTIVPPDAGAAVGRIPLPKLGRRRR